MKVKEIEYTISESGCYLCTSHYLNKDGYPKISKGGRKFLMNRYLWEQQNGPIPKGICVLHKCDVPSCINLDHFFLGTPRIDNHTQEYLVKKMAIAN